MASDMDVIIIGGGPAGLSAAVALKQAGVARVVVLERESEAGGIPRHCGHPPFGMREFNRIYTGPQYARRLVARALDAGVEIRTLTTVVEARAGGVLLVSGKAGPEEMSARRVIHATGVRETPRSARIISGSRPLGVVNTGALQSMIYLKHRRPFRRPVIVGTELVSFSAIQTCRHMGIKPVAMIEANNRVTARWFFGLYPRLVGVRLHLETSLSAIRGDRKVEGVEVTGPDGTIRQIDCDGVLLTGRFTPESSLARCGHLQVDAGTGGPVIDQYGRCSDPVYFATGNLLRPVETAGWSWHEGRQTGRWVAADLAGKLPAADALIDIEVADPRIKFAMPQKLAISNGRVRASAGMGYLQMRLSQPVSGKLVAGNAAGKVLWQKTIQSLPERRILLPLAELLVEPDRQVILKIESL